jgi:hypothetical protein
MDRNDWTPAVLITATVSLVTAGLVSLLAPWGAGREPPPGPDRPRHALASEVVVWIGELGPQLKGVLGPVWGDSEPDRDHDGLLNQDLGLSGPEALSYYRLLVFNTSAEPRTLTLGDGRIVMEGENGDRVYLKNLAAMVERGELSLSPSLAFSLRSLGALSERVEIPPGQAASLMVPFNGEARIETARAVALADEREFRRRQMARASFRRLIEDPDETRVKDL